MVEIRLDLSEAKTCRHECRHSRSWGLRHKAHLVDLVVMLLNRGSE
jgi:hypothetical protein